MIYNYEKLKDRLIFFCKRDGITPPSTAGEDEAGRCINNSYRKFVQETNFQYNYEDILIPASSDYPNRIVPVTLPVDNIGSPRYYSLEKIIYPSTGYTEILSTHWRLIGGTLYIYTTQTNGTDYATIFGYTTPDEMEGDGEEPIIPNEHREAIVWGACLEWMPAYAVTPLQMQRIQMYDSLRKSELDRVRKKIQPRMKERKSHKIKDVWVSFI